MPLHLPQRQFIDAAWASSGASRPNKLWGALATVAGIMVLGIAAVAETSPADRWLPIVAWSTAATGIFLARRRSGP